MQGIKFNQDGITAILEGRKTQTRRTINITDVFEEDFGQIIKVYYDKEEGYAVFDREDMTEKYNSKYKIGETVFVQEDYAYQTLEDKQEKYIINSSINKLVHRAGHPCSEINYIWTNASAMTEKEARIFLKITNIKVERLQDISEEDCIKEGVVRGEYATEDGGAFMYFIDNSIATYNNPQICFKKEIWDILPYQEPYRFEDTPYVFCYEFQRIEDV